MHLVGIEPKISPFICLKDKEVSTLTKVVKASSLDKLSFYFIYNLLIIL